ncbi:thiamine phosphate synthase [Edaphobacter aggregans]|uniref:thiamine phosphate synthase n=1 Tax=Edaphobacter aggregans TaxID=570835 RepID=UPI0006908F2B|nr:thiamine phosphate synthase [Edaphobacter aggregans]
MGKTARGRLSSRALRLPRLYPIVDAEMLASRGLALSWFVEKLRDAGVTLLQYRDKRGTDEESLRNAKIIDEVFRGHSPMLVMNDSPVLAMLSGWNKVHVGQGDAAIAEARAVLQPGGIVGCSTHTDEQVQSADAAGADYIAIGPVFATSTKADAEPVVGLQGVKRARELTTRPLVAIGGILPENAGSVIRAGADSVAVIGALLNREPGAVVRAFLKSMPRPERNQSVR